jgi:kynurenine formamidase
VVINRVNEATENANYLLSIDDIKDFEDEQARLPKGGWLLYRMGWDARAHDDRMGWDARAHDDLTFLNVDEDGPHTPGIGVDCARFLAKESPIVGVGVQTVGIDAGAVGSVDSPPPCHRFLLGAGKYGLTHLANLAELPPAGACRVLCALKMESGSGGPARAFAFVPS